MAQLTRNDSAGVISSLMHYGDSDDEDNSSSRNNSVDERSAEVKGEESTQRGEEAMEEGEATAADATSTLTTQEEAPTDSPVPPLKTLVPEEVRQNGSTLLFTKPVEINAAPAVVINAAPVVEAMEEEAAAGALGTLGTPVDNISDDEHDHQSEVDRGPPPPIDDKGGLVSDPPSRDSPASPGKERKAMMRLVSYGPEDHEDMTDSESEVEEAHESNDSSDEHNDSSSLSHSVHNQNIASEDIRIPPEPSGQCDPKVQENIKIKLEKLKRSRMTFNEEIGYMQSFRNPSIYEKLIELVNIDQKGSNFPLKVYDPHIWGKESFYDELDKAQRKDMERREKEKREKTKIDFVTGVKKSSSSSASSDMPGHTDEKKRKSKWDTQPSGASVKAPGVQGPGVVNLTATATGTKATVISAVGSLSKNSSRDSKK